MSALYILLSVSLAVAAAFLVAYLWSVRKGQFDDMATPSFRILFEEEAPEEPPVSTNPNEIKN